MKGDFDMKTKNTISVRKTRTARKNVLEYLVGNAYMFMSVPCMMDRMFYNYMAPEYSKA